MERTPLLPLGIGLSLVSFSLMGHSLKACGSMRLVPLCSIPEAGRGRVALPVGLQAQERAKQP